MKLPIPNELLEIEHNGKIAAAFVDSIIPRADKRNWYDITLQVDGDFQQGDECYWTDGQGSAIQCSRVQKVAKWENITKIVMLAKVEP